MVHKIDENGNIVQSFTEGMGMLPDQYRNPEKYRNHKKSKKSRNRSSYYDDFSSRDNMYFSIFFF